MANLAWSITVLAALCYSTEGAQGTTRHVTIQDTPIQVRTARPFEPLEFENIELDRAITIVAKGYVMFRESHQSAIYPAIIILNKLQDNGSSYIDVSVFDIRNIAAKTWQPFHREVNLDQTVGIACSELRWLPTSTVSPSKRHIIVYGFGTGYCAEKLFIYGDRRSRVITTTGGHAAMGAALATLPVSESDNSTFDLFAFGGTECLELRNSSCKDFSNSLRRLRIVSREACLNCSWHQWRVIYMRKGIPSPTSRVHAHMFADGKSLLLFGGFVRQSRGNSSWSQFFPDFWRYSLDSEQWVNLECNLNPTRFYLPYLIATGSYAAFKSENNELIFLYDYGLYLCSVHRLRASCTKNYRYKLLSSSYYLSAGHSYFYLIRSKTNNYPSFKVQLFRSGSREYETIGAIPSPQIQEDIDDRCPAFQGHSSIPSMFVPSDDRQRDQYLFFVPASMDSTYEKWWRVPQSRAPPMSIWSLQHGSTYTNPIARNDYMYTHKINLPPPASYSSVTYLNPSTALMGESTRLGTMQVWCLSIPTYSWTLATPSSTHVPSSRTDHIAYRYRSTGMVLYGGITDELQALGDLWIFQLQESSNNCTGSWHNLTPYVKEGVLPKQYLPSVTEYGEGVIMFGGFLSRQDSGKGTMFMVQIRSLKHVAVRNIEIIPSIQNRIYHTLSRYTKTDLILLGGTQFTKTSTREEAEEALMMTLVEANNTIVAKWTLFFKFRITYHTVLNNRIFSGLDPAGAKTRRFYEIKNINQCPKGYQRDRNNSCRPCPIGYYSATIEQQCEKCVNLTTTTSEGSTNCDPINPCTGKYCHGHGTCFVDKADYKPFCTCQFGYLPSDRCKVPSVYLALMAAVVFATTATILVIALYQFVRKRRALNATEIQLGHTNRDLQRHRKKLRRINRGTLIRWSDLTIREQLASGTYSKVLLAELGDMTVAVKQFPSYFTIGSLSSPYDVFIQEAEILRGLRHPNIVMFLGAGRDTTSGCPFLVMEYLKRGSLHDILHDPSNSIEHCDRLRFALDAARGLKYLHSSSPPQIHRDIKSPNLLVSDKWVVKVGDLETARFLATMDDGDGENVELNSQHEDASSRTLHHSVSYNTGSEPLTTPLLANDTLPANPAGEADVTSRVGMTCGAGTDRWRSPESIKKNIYTEKHDVYSFGVVLWEIITRLTPYSNFTCSESILDEIVNERKPIFPPSAPYAYRHLAEQCMKTDAVDRPTIQRVVRELTDQIENNC